MECLHGNEIRYGEFSKLFLDKIGNLRLPLSGSIEATWRCNLQCSHCFLNLPAADCTALEHELSLGEWREIIDQIVAEGCLWLLLTGGEPFLRPDFLDLYTYAKQKGLFITLFTNGTLITPAIADQLAKWRPFAVEITIYGRTEATYEAVTGVPGSYDRCVRAIHLLRDRKINLALKTMVTRSNRHELAGMKDWATGLGLTFRYDAVLSPRINGSRTPCTLRIPPEEVVELDIQDAARFKGWEEFIKVFQDQPDSDEIFICGAGLRSFHIDPYGGLSACMLARYPDYQLSRGSFQEGWRDFLLKVRRQKRQQESPCAQCGLISLCDQCPGWSQLEHGNQEQRVEYLCSIAHLRAEAFGLPHSSQQKEANYEHQEDLQKTEFD